MIISISGTQGSGKSTLAQDLAEKLKWPRYYIGGLRREAAKKRGLTLAEYNKLGENDPATDQEVDFYQKELGEKSDNFIIEGRTSWYFIPHSFKIYVDVSPEIGAKRIFKDLELNAGIRNEDKNLNSWEDVLISNNNRFKSDTTRYKQYYDINVNDKKNYDFVIDASALSPEEAFNQVYAEIKKHLA